MRKIKNELKKFFLRIFNKPKYYQFRIELRAIKNKKKLSVDFTNKLEKITKAIHSKKDLNFKHSGHLGDLIYSFPVIQELAKTRKCNLYIKINEPYNGYYHKHPSGNSMITKRSYEMILPLLKSQDYLSRISLFNNQKIDIDLDLFRDLPCSHQFHSCRWYFQLTGIQTDLNTPYLKVDPHHSIKNKIVIVKTARSKNEFLDYSFLNKYNNLLFLGTKNEYEELKLTIPSLEFYNIKDFLELAQIIKSSHLYLSNQTFAYAIAEGLKVNRILEANPNFPVIFPIGGNGRDVYFQHHFETIFEEFQKIKKSSS